MLMPVTHILGMPVFLDINNTVCKRIVPVRSLSLKKWHEGTSYQKRIQKKWNKRFGTKVQDSVLKTPYGFLISTDAWDKLRKEMEKENLLC